MGTDIHLFVEKQNDDESWSLVKELPARTCTWCGGKGHYEKRPDDQCYSCKGSGKETGGYHNRNYDVFAMLAGVRNGSGFAGVGFVPLADPRGIPADLSEGLDQSWTDDAERWDQDEHPPWLGDHSHSHCTLAEALAYDYGRTTKHRGVVSAATYSAWKEAGAKGPPSSYSGAIWGQQIETVKPVEMDRLIRTGVVKTTPAEEGPGIIDGSEVASDGKRYYTQVEWEETYRESAGEAWFEFLDSLRALGDPEDIRLVFGFDS